MFINRSKYYLKCIKFYISNKCLICYKRTLNFLLYSKGRFLHNIIKPCIDQSSVLICRITLQVSVDYLQSWCYWTWNVSCHKTLIVLESTDVVPSDEHSGPLAPWWYVRNLHRHKPIVKKNISGNVLQAWWSLTFDLLCLYSYWWLTPWTFRQWLSREHRCVNDFSQRLHL